MSDSRDFIELEGFRLPVFQGDPGWIPKTDIVLTPATRVNLRKILPPLLRGHNLLLIGDAGVGKNALIYYINSLRRHPTIRYSFNEDTLPEDLVGSYRIQPGGFVWSDGALSLAMRKGATFVADEMNLASPEVLKRFQSVFTERRLQILEGDGSVIEPHRGFSFVATQNPSEGYEGRKPLLREMQKYFTTVYLDPYPDEELVAILSGLYSSIPEYVLRTIVRICRTVEELVVRKKVGARDLERYHFNLRNLKRLAARLEDQPEHLMLELTDIFIRPFRLEEDRVLLRQTIEEILIEDGLSSYIPEANRRIEIHVDLENGRIDIGRARLPLKGPDRKERVERALRNFAVVPARLELLEAIARALQFQENVLLESDADVEPDDFARFFADLAGLPVHAIFLSRGMHTSDVLGGLKPAGRDQVVWVDGPLTEGLRSGGILLIQGLEAAGPELVEKMNMLMDDARAISLPAESGESEPLKLKDGAYVFGVKYFRIQKTTPTISRAFRNRFSAFVVPPVVDAESLLGIIEHALSLDEGEGSYLTELILQFHIFARSKAEKREIGATRMQPYRYGLTNLQRFVDLVGWAAAEPENLTAEKLREAIIEGASIAYINEIADPSERRMMVTALEKMLDGTDLSILLQEFQSVSKKKSLNLKPPLKGKVSWNQEEHWREATTGKASWNREPQRLKKGLNINTPETGGSTKEGEDAWYGADTKGNRGVGEPGHGGGAWGYRTEELYREFLKKRRPLWSYHLGVSPEEFFEVFAPEIERVSLDLEHLLDPDVQIRRQHRAEGSRVDARRYLSYLSGRGDDRIFDKTTIRIDEDRLRGVEVLFALNKGRRIFNFDYSVAVLVAIMSAAEILDSHRISFGVIGYSDLTNQKMDIDLEWHKQLMDNWTRERQNELFYGLASGWHGDTVSEYQILDELSTMFSADAKTRILVMSSDFRGARARVTVEKDLASRDTRELKSQMEKLESRGIVLLGVGLGPRNLASELFRHHLSITEVNYTALPSMLAQEISSLIHRYHEV
jgi:MoxR-like ATPase